ncbi:MAG TPA: DUF6259 domain-containing protein [Chthoniobacterales bacterium]|nr:DUF6259 domain-containing protein [Chthoniobacterales bacterium]
MSKSNQLTNQTPGSPSVEDWWNEGAGREPLILEDQKVRAVFDAKTGAWIDYQHKATGWKALKRAELGQSFRAYVTWKDRLFNPVSGLRCRLARATIDVSSRQINLEWDRLQTSGGTALAVNLFTEVRLEEGRLKFSGRLKNGSDATITTLSWPVVGDLVPPAPTDSLFRENLDYGTMKRTPLWPRMGNERGYYGTNYPMQIEGKGSLVPGIPGAYHFPQRFVLLSADTQGIYIGVHDTSARQMVCFQSELRPGYLDSFHAISPDLSRVGETPVHLTFESVHYPFAAPCETTELPDIVIEVYSGDWHSGIDIYRRWRATWYCRAPGPDWIHEVHSWQQIQIGSAEDDLRTPFRDLPNRASQLADNGVTALQLVGWNQGGQDRGNPLHDPDERLGTWEDLKTAISKIESLGVRVILFNKFVWADVTRPDYSSFLKSAAVDPYGMPYYHPGYEYQTPVQWMSINNRRFMVACLHDPDWIDLCKREFEKSLSLGASGVLYDEAFHHYAATHCFSGEHGHRVPATLASADLTLGHTFRELLHQRSNFLLCAEAPFDLQHQHYGLSYYRIFDGHIPAERYADPFYPIMIAVTGFDDREMINRALLYRYIISYEPYNFKGNLSDFPLTVEYGKRVDAFRARYSDYLWNAEFQDSIGAKIDSAAGGSISYSVFWNPERRLRAVVLINDDRGSEHEVTLELDGTPSLFCASPEFPELESCGSKILVPPRSAVVVFQKPQAS